VIFLKKKLIILFLIIVLAVVFTYLQNNMLELTELETYSKKLPDSFDGVKIVHLSDLHSKYFGRDQNKLVRMIAGEKPDIIVMTGDMVDVRSDNENASISLIKNAVKIAPVYYITGNHECWSERLVQMETNTRAAGAIVLRNTSQKISVDGEYIYITGLDDPASSDEIYEKGNFIENKLQDTIPLLEDDSFKIVLSHRPEAFKLYCSYGIDLVFCGHAHGGQFRLPFMGALYAPGQGYFPDYTSGAYTGLNTTMVVSRGLGNSRIPLRLFNRPEVVAVTLRKGTPPSAN